MNPTAIDANFKRRTQFIAFAAVVLTASGFVFSSVAPVQAIGFSIGANFADGNRSASGFIPPDTMGGVGPNNVAVMINGLYRVYSKAGIQQQSKSLNQFWIDAGQTPLAHLPSIRAFFTIPPAAAGSPAPLTTRTPQITFWSAYPRLIIRPAPGPVSKSMPTPTI